MILGILYLNILFLDESVAVKGNWLIFLNQNYARLIFRKIQYLTVTINGVSIYLLFCGNCDN